MISNLLRSCIEAPFTLDHICFGNIHRFIQGHIKHYCFIYQIKKHTKAMSEDKCLAIL